MLDILNPESEKFAFLDSDFWVGRMTNVLNAFDDETLMSAMIHLPEGMLRIFDLKHFYDYAIATNNKTLLLYCDELPGFSSESISHKCQARHLLIMGRFAVLTHFFSNRDIQQINSIVAISNIFRIIEDRVDFTCWFYEIVDSPSCSYKRSDFNL